MNLGIVYPPMGYYYMPYLAPFLLKGHVEQVSSHSAKTLDLNIRYYLQHWGKDTNIASARLLRNRGQRGPALLAEMMAEHGLRSWQALRDEQTYRNPDDVAGHAAVLRSATRIIRDVDREAFAHGLLPSVRGTRDRLRDHWEHSLVGSFLKCQIASLRGFDAIGISATYVEQLLPAYLLAHYAKLDEPSRPVIVGGGAATHFFDDLLRDESFWTAVDAVIPFEGEFSLVELLDGFAGYASMPTANVALRRSDGSVTYQRDLVNRPQVHATPDFSDLEDLYPTPEPVMPLLTSKGCYWGKCAYCTHHEGYGQGFHHLDTEVFLHSLRALVEQGRRYFYFVDEAIPPRMMKRFVDIFLSLHQDESRSHELNWMAESRLDRPLANKAAVQRLKDSGCRLLISGIESGNQSVSNRMRKGIDLDLVARHARLCGEAGGVPTGWMFFVGFPGETPLQARETFEFLHRNRHWVDYASIGTFSLERGSPIWLTPQSFGVAEVLDRDAPYKPSYDYRLADSGAVVRTSQHRQLLHELSGDFPAVRDLFRRAIDRALVLFIEPKQPVTSLEEQCPPSPPHKRWFSAAEGKVVSWHTSGNQMHVGVLHQPDDRSA